MTAPRFYIDHGMIHDRVTGKHVTTAPDDETWNGGTISHALELLNELSRSTRDEVVEECAKLCDDYKRDGELRREYACETADELAARIRDLKSPDTSVEPSGRKIG